jgi:hypothetical protein
MQIVFIIYKRPFGNKMMTYVIDTLLFYKCIITMKTPRNMY